MAVAWLYVSFLFICAVNSTCLYFSLGYLVCYMFMHITEVVLDFGERFVWGGGQWFDLLWNVGAFLKEKGWFGVNLWF